MSTSKEVLAQFVPWSTEGNGWKVWAGNTETGYSCVAVCAEYRDASMLSVALKNVTCPSTITRGDTTGITVTEVREEPPEAGKS